MDYKYSPDDSLSDNERDNERDNGVNGDNERVLEHFSIESHIKRNPDEIGKVGSLWDESKPVKVKAPPSGKFDEKNDQCFYTTLKELDEIDEINDKESRDFVLKNKAKMFTSPTDSDNYIKAVRPGGVLRHPSDTIDYTVSSENYNRQQSDDTQLPTTPTTEPIPEKERINNLDKKAKEDNEIEYKKKAFHNTTIYDFVKSIANSYIDIINDIPSIRSLDDLQEVFVKDERLIAIGILLVCISVFFIFFKNTIS
jgi:hypothetical protein